MSDDPTPAESSNAKRSSAQYALAMRDCPKCMRDAYSKTCALCGGGRKVAQETAIAWSVGNSPESEPPRKP